MRKEDASATINEFSLLSSELSNRVLRSIICGDPAPGSELNGEDRSHILEIAAAYRAKVAELNGKTYPPTLPFLLLAKQRYPAIRISEADGHQTGDVYFRGIKPSLLSLLLGRVPPGELAAAPSGSTSAPARSSSLPRCCRPVFEQECIIPSTRRSAKLFTEWLNHGRRGERISIVAPICPDYSAETTPSGDIRYTFEGVGGGVSLAGRRLYRSLPALLNLLVARLRIENLTLHAVVGDFEAFSADNQARFKLSEAEFLERVHQSVRSLQESAPCNLDVKGFTHYCGGKHGWFTENAAIRRRLVLAGFPSHADRQVIYKVAEQRRSLFRRWFASKTLSDEAIFTILQLQATEYATMGAILSRQLPLPMIIAVGTGTMTQFFSAAAPLPVLQIQSDGVVHDRTNQPISN